MVLATVPTEFPLLTLGFNRVLTLVVGKEGHWVALFRGSEDRLARFRMSERLRRFAPGNV